MKMTADDIVYELENYLHRYDIDVDDAYCFIDKVSDLVERVKNANG